MSETQIIAWIGFVLAGMFTGFMTGYFIGFDRAMEKVDFDPRRYEWYRWPRVRVPLDDVKGDYALARELNKWLTDNVHEKKFKIQVLDGAEQVWPPHCVFFIQDRNIALTLSLKYNITYVPGYGEGYQ